jgi:hypothetical protein
VSDLGSQAFHTQMPQLCKVRWYAMFVLTLTIPNVSTFPFLGLYADNNNLSPQAIGSSASKDEHKQSILTPELWVKGSQRIYVD